MEHQHLGGKSCEELVREVTEGYEKTLSFPKEKPVPAVVVALVGLIGTGKTIVSKALEKNLPLLRIEGDELRRILRMRNEGYAHIDGLRKTISLKYFNQGYSIIFDSDGASGGLVEDYQKYIDRGLKIIWLRIIAPQSVILERLEKRPPDPIFANSPRAIHDYFRRKHLHEHLAMPLTFTLDTSLPLEPQIGEALPLVRHAAGWNAVP